MVGVPVALVVTILTALATTIGTTVGPAAWWSHYPGCVWSKVMVRLMLLPIEVKGRENMQEGQSYVIVPNHQGAYDIFMIYGYLGRPFKWMMKESLRHIPLVGYACEKAGFIFVDRTGIHKIQHTYEQARRVLRDGVSVVIFPEGHRTPDGDIHKFQRGAFQLACELGLPLLPVTIDGSYRLLPRKKGLWFLTWTPLKMTIHQPIQPINTGVEYERDLMEQTRQSIESAL